MFNINSSVFFLLKLGRHLSPISLKKQPGLAWTTKKPKGPGSVSMERPWILCKAGGGTSLSNTQNKFYAWGRSWRNNFLKLLHFSNSKETWHKILISCRAVSLTVFLCITVNKYWAKCCIPTWLHVSHSGSGPSISLIAVVSAHSAETKTVHTSEKESCYGTTFHVEHLCSGSVKKESTKSN